MKLHRGVWLPDEDTHFARMMDKAPPQMLRGREVGVYQFQKMQGALAHVKEFRVAVDVGAHVGLWSMWLADRFQRLEAFEPRAEHVQCWRENVRNSNATMHPFALGASPGEVGLIADPENTGKTHIQGHGETKLCALDAWGFGMVDFLKIDVEGYESAVIVGARDTLLRCRPVVVVESNGQHGRYGLPEPVQMLAGMGASVLQSFGHDVVMGWPC